MGQLESKAYQTLFTWPPLRGLGEADREAVAALFYERTLPRGAVLFREGDPGTSLFLIVTGEVRVRSGERVLAYFGPGESIGEMALVTGAPRSATVEVSLDCRLLVLDGDAFDSLLALEPRLHAELAALLSRRLSNANHPERAARFPERVFVENLGRWADRDAVVAALAASLERQVGAAIACVSVARPGHGPLAAPRHHRADAVVLGDGSDGGTLRDRLAARLALLAGQAPVTLVEVDEGLGAAAEEVLSLADAVVVLADDAVPERPAPGGPRRIVLHDRRRGTTPVLADSGQVALPRETSARQRALDRVARILCRRSVGLALGSGTAYGLAHIGVLAALDEAGVPIDCVAGSSMGAIVGAGYAAGMSPGALREMALGLGRAATVLRMVPGLLALALDVPLPGRLGGDRFVRFLEAFGPVRDGHFSDLEIPFRAVATDIESGARVEIGDGPLCDAMRASASVPWFLAPYRLGDRHLIDGGTTDPVPCATVRNLGADVVIAVNAIPPLDPGASNPLASVLRALEWVNPLAYLGRRPPGPGNLDVAMRSLLLLQHALGNARAGEADVLITPALQGFWVLDFWHADALIEKGAEAARAALPMIREAIAARPGPAGDRRLGLASVRLRQAEERLAHTGPR